MIYLYFFQSLIFCPHYQKARWIIIILSPIQQTGYFWWGQATVEDPKSILQVPSLCQGSSYSRKMFGSSEVVVPWGLQRFCALFSCFEELKPMGVFLVLVKVRPRPGCEKSLSKKEWDGVTFSEILRQKTKKRRNTTIGINHQATQPPPIHYGLLLHLMLVSFFFSKSS